jgi:ABC-type branched-subunit amino acid transport system substrate-binding protein
MSLMSLPLPFRLARCFAIAGALAIAACATQRPAPAPAPPAPPPPPVAANPLDRDQPDYLRLPGLGSGAPVRVGIILPFSASSAGTRGLAASMMKAAELAMFDSKNRNMLLMTADEGNGGPDAAAAARKLLAQGAEVIVGPLFGPSVAAVAPVARDRGVPVLAFSTERSVAGGGVYLVSFLPQSEVARVISYAASQGRSKFAALLPQTAYGDVAGEAFNKAVAGAHGQVVDVERFAPNTAAVMAPAAKVAQSGADAVLIAQGGTVLKAIAPTLAFDGAPDAKMRLLGTGLWDDPSLARESTLEGGWYAAPAPNADDAFAAKYRTAFNQGPAQLASLAYDAVSLVALLAQGEPYHRFTQSALMDPNGFAGVTGIFRFAPDGTSERGLAVMEMQQGGPVVVSPAPTTFQQPSG